MAARRIPPGRVATYGDLARLAGRPGAARAVGNIMRQGGQPGVPYHRVIAAGGRAGGYGGNEALKHDLLRREGLTVIGGRVVASRPFAGRIPANTANDQAVTAGPSRDM